MVLTVLPKSGSVCCGSARSTSITALRRHVVVDVGHLHSLLPVVGVQLGDGPIQLEDVSHGAGYSALRPDYTQEVSDYRGVAPAMG